MYGIVHRCRKNTPDDGAGSVAMGASVNAAKVWHRRRTRSTGGTGKISPHPGPDPRFGGKISPPFPTTPSESRRIDRC